MRHNQARECGMIQYSALVNSVFNNKFNTFFGLNLTLVYTFPMCMAWRFHFPIRNYDFKVIRLCVVFFSVLCHLMKKATETVSRLYLSTVQVCMFSFVCINIQMQIL